MAEARRFGRLRLKIVADPSAVPFYERMGAVPCGEEPNALIPGRMLPVRRFGLTRLLVNEVATRDSSLHGDC